MKESIDGEAFKAWLRTTKSLSVKGCSDVVSRLNRCLRLEPLGSYVSAAAYLDAVLQNPHLDSIPESSRNSMFRSAKLYFEFIESRS